MFNNEQQSYSLLRANSQLILMTDFMIKEDI